MEKVSRTKVAGLCLSLKIQLCFPLQDQDPFVFGLVVPEVRRAGMPGGDDAFNGQAGSF